MKAIPQMEPWFGDEEKKAINNYMDEGGWLTEFKRTAQFENEIANYTGAKHCIVVNNGTISLTLMALAAGIMPGDEVIVPNFTMIATANAVRMIGAKPVFVDVEEDTLCMDIQCAKEAITEKTKAIFFVAANGRYPLVGIEAFSELCKIKGILLLEDTAQSLGSFYPNGKHQGTVGLAGSFSFSAPKVISTGQGGAIVTDDDVVADKLRRLKDFGRSGGGNDIHDSVGYNFKFTELQAVIGIEQMKKLQWRVDRKREILKLYQSRLENVAEVKFFSQDMKYTTPWFIDVLVENRDELQKYLADQKIGTRVMYPPINAQKAYNIEGSFPQCERVGRSGLWLPSASQLKNDDIVRITDTISRFYNM